MGSTLLFGTHGQGVDSAAALWCHHAMTSVAALQVGELKRCWTWS
jgi:hypothetical protein